jgi:myo-inositol-1-phosphate synthase
VQDGDIRVAMNGVGNRASLLVHGVEHNKHPKSDTFIPGVMRVNIGGYYIRDIEVMAALDVDAAG